MKKKLSFSGLSQAMKHGCTTMNLRTNVKAQSGNTCHHPGPSQKYAFSSKVMVVLFWD
jgi:hypothetical protein